jgi:predicted permease
VILIAVAVFAAMIVGAQARKKTDRTDRVVTLALDFVLLILLPLIAFAFGTKVELKVSTIVGLLAGYAVVATVGVLAWQITSRRMALSARQQGAVVLSVVLANTGYFGLPVSVALLGKEHLPQSVTWDQLISGPMAYLIAPFIAGSFAGAHEGLHLGSRLLTTVKRAPAIPALIAGLLVPSDWIPSWFLDFATVCVYATLPLGFFAVGATIQRLQAGGIPPPRSAIVLTVGLRIVAAPLIFLGLALTVLPHQPDAFKLAAAMPCGINALIVGHAFDLDRGLTSIAIAWSTGIVTVAALAGSVLL